MAELGGRREQSHRFVFILQSSAAGDMEHGESKHRVHITAVCGELVPFNGLGVVARDAEAIGIKLAQQGHRFRIAVRVDPLRRFLEGGEVVSALKCPEGGISRSRWCRGCRRRLRGLHGFGRSRFCGRGLGRFLCRRRFVFGRFCGWRCVLLRAGAGRAKQEASRHGQANETRAEKSHAVTCARACARAAAQPCGSAKAGSPIAMKSAPAAHSSPMSPNRSA